MLILLSRCGLDKTRKSSVQKRLAEIDKSVQDRKTKFRPCFVIPDRYKNIEGDSERTKICLMATFEGSGIDRLLLMLRHFVVSVKTDPNDWNTTILNNAEYITTSPLWKAKDGVKSQWVICFLYKVSTADLGRWGEG